MPRKILLSLLLLFVSMVIFASGNSAAAAPEAKPLGYCRSSLWLTPHSIPGPPWQQHRHWLEAPIPIDGTYTIINMTTHASFHWDSWGHQYPGNHTRFGVSTWYAYAYPQGSFKVAGGGGAPLRTTTIRGGSGAIRRANTVSRSTPRLSHGTSTPTSLTLKEPWPTPCGLATRGSFSTTVRVSSTPEEMQARG